MKRKVTDLLPNEAILISNDSERDAILQLFSEIALVLAKDELLNYPFYLRLNRAPVKIWTHKRLWLNTLIVPATDFIGSEGEGVEVDWKKIAEQVTSELEKVSEFFRNFNRPNDTFGTFVSKQIEFDELSESVNRTLELTRNTQTNEQR